MIKAIILDFDNTLCMTARSNFEMQDKTIRSLNLDPIPFEDYSKTVGDTLQTFIEKYYPVIKFEDFLERYSTIRNETLKKGLIEVVPEENLQVLDVLAKQGKQLMILTSRREVGVAYMMDKKHHLGSRIAHFYHLGNNPYHKPDPRTFEVIEKEHDLKPSECVYVGDTPHDAAAANGAGLCLIISLESGIHTKKDFAKYKVDAFVDKFPEVLNKIHKLN